MAPLEDRRNVLKEQIETPETMLIEKSEVIKQVGDLEKLGINFFVLPPRLPKLNGGVERAHRTHTEEFYEVTASSFDLSELKDELLEWEQVYNTVRPHQVLGYVTSLKFLEEYGG